MYDYDREMYLSSRDEYILEVADFFIDNKPSISKCAEEFGISYGKCWSILRKELAYVDDDRFVQVRNIIRSL